MKKFILGLLSFAVLNLCASRSCALQYKIHDLGVLPGLNYGIAWDISNDGQIVGGCSWEYTSYPQNAAFRWKNGSLQELPKLPGYEQSTCTAISVNDSCILGQSAGHHVLWQNNTVKQLSYTVVDMSDCGNLVGVNAVYNADGTLSHYLRADYGAYNVSPYSINDAKQVAGSVDKSSSFPSSVVLARIWNNDGSIIALDCLPGDNLGWCTAINNNGQVAGNSQHQYINGSSDCHAFFWSQSAGMVALRSLPQARGAWDFAYGINDHGQVVGASWSVAVVWNPDGSVFQLPGTLPGYSSTAYAINDNGWIVGEVAGRPILWEPVPEPSSLLALLCGLGGTGVLLRRRR